MNNDGNNSDLHTTIYSSFFFILYIPQYCTLKGTNSSQWGTKLKHLFRKHIIYRFLWTSQPYSTGDEGQICFVLNNKYLYETFDKYILEQIYE